MIMDVSNLREFSNGIYSVFVVEAVEELVTIWMVFPAGFGSSSMVEVATSSDDDAVSTGVLLSVGGFFIVENISLKLAVASS